MSQSEFSPEELEKIRSMLVSSGEEPATKTKNSEAPQEKVPKKKWYRNRVSLLLVGVVAAILLAVIYVLAVEPWLAMQRANSELSSGQTTSAVIAGNDEILSFTPQEPGDILSGANPNQLALGKDGETTVPSYFEFRSDQSNEKSHVLDLYLDFYSQRSRDLISLNQSTLSGYIGTGRIILRVHPVVDTAGFSVYGPEALAEVMGTEPKLAWPFFVNLMKESDTLLSAINPEEAKEPTSQEVVDFIALVAKNSGVPSGAPAGVDADSIKYLSFFSWLYAGSRDEKLATGYYPPVLYVDGEEIDQEKWILTNPDSMLKLLSTLR